MAVAFQSDSAEAAKSKEHPGGGSEGGGRHMGGADHIEWGCQVAASMPQRTGAGCPAWLVLMPVPGVRDRGRESGRKVKAESWHGEDKAWNLRDLARMRLYSVLESLPPEPGYLPNFGPGWDQRRVCRSCTAGTVRGKRDPNHTHQVLSGWIRTQVQVCAIIYSNDSAWAKQN